MATLSTLAILSLQLLLFVSATVSAQETTTSLPPAEPPTHHHPPAYPPTVLPPTKPPVPPPTKPPVEPPVTPPAQPPVKPPAQPPAQPPVKPPAHPPVKPPAQPPAQPPVKPPAYPPVTPPFHPGVPRGYLAVRGVVFCKPTCEFSGNKHVLGGGALPLPGATVILVCNNTRLGSQVTATTNPDGFFYVQAPAGTTKVRSCRVKLGMSPSPKCPVPSALFRGNTGSRIRPDNPLVFLGPEKEPVQVFTVGPFAFEPNCKI